jgi:hypothetical protein
VGRVFIVDIPLDRVAVLSFNDTIERIEAERMPHLAMDVTPQQVNATGVYAGENLPQAYTGAGVAAGVFDCYYDFTHPAFLDANGDLRVRYYYDFHWPNADSTLDTLWRRLPKSPPTNIRSTPATISTAPT